MKLIFAGYTGSKNSVWNRLKIQFVELDFSNLIFQKSSTDRKRVGLVLTKFYTKFSPTQLFEVEEDIWFNVISGVQTPLKTISG